MLDDRAAPVRSNGSASVIAARTIRVIAPVRALCVDLDRTIDAATYRLDPSRYGVISQDLPAEEVAHPTHAATSDRHTRSLAVSAEAENLCKT
ncbi:hypothetical protein GYB14_11725 [bacterium]|nr:hypothetical protein [bacterium]